MVQHKKPQDTSEHLQEARDIIEKAVERPRAGDNQEGSLLPARPKASTRLRQMMC